MSATTPPPVNGGEDPRSFFALMRELPATLLELARAEIEQFKREMGRKLRNLGAGALMFAIAATLGLFLLGTLIAAGILALAMVMPGWAAALVVAGALLLIMIILIAVGAAKFRNNAPIPTETIDSLVEDAHALKGEGRFDHATD